MRRGLLQKHAELLSLFFRMGDVGVVVVGAIVAYWIRFDTLALAYQYQIAIVVVSLSVLVLFPALQLYQPWRGASIWEEVGRVTVAWIGVVSACAVLTYLTKTGEMFSRIWVGTWFLLVLLALVMFRVGLRLVLQRMRTNGYNSRKVAVLGAGSLGRHVARKLETETWSGLKVVAFFDDDNMLHGKTVDGIPVCGELESAAKYLSGTQENQRSTEENSRGDTIKVDQVWFALPLTAADRVKTILANFDQTVATVQFVPDIFGYRLLNQSIDEIAGIPVVNLSSTSIEGIDKILKEIEDRVLGSLFLVLSSPLMFAIAITIMLTSKGPVFYRETRVTWGGREFEMLKFRTMPENMEKESGPIRLENGEMGAPDMTDKATSVGAILRRTNLDELPQLINVVKGDMSIVGPRPERPRFISEVRRDIPMYMRKHLVKGGMTGWAQVNGWRGQTSLKKRIEHDIFYIENWSLWLDLKIMIWTLFKRPKNKKTA